MKLKKYVYSCITVLAAVLMLAQTASAVRLTAAYSSTATAPMIYTKNYSYNVAFPVLGPPPSNATLTVVNYTWSYSYPRPAGLQVLLCNNAGTLCANITSFGSGRVDFSGHGVRANEALRLYAYVQGTGTMAPLWGSTANVSVNYEYEYN